MSSTTATSCPQSLIDTAYEVLDSLITDRGYVSGKATDSEKTETYWHIGKALVNLVGPDDTKARALAKAVGPMLNRKHHRGFANTALLDARRVYLAFPHEEDMSSNLSWSQYVVLSKVSDADRRGLLLKKAQERGWSSYELERYARGIRDGLDVIDTWYSDDLVCCYARAYVATCGVIPVDVVHAIYLDEVESPVDDFDFSETVQYLRRHGREEALPAVWRYEDKDYLIDRSLAAMLAEHRKMGSQRNHYLGFDDSDYYNRDPYGNDSEVEMRRVFERELKARRSQSAFDDATRLARRQDVSSFKRIDPHDVRRGPMALVLDSHATDRLFLQLCDTNQRKPDQEACLRETEAELQFDLWRLAQQVCRTGLPSREELEADALFLITVTGAQDASPSLVSSTLREVYRALPQWRLGGYTQQDVEERDKSKEWSQYLALEG